MTNPQSAGKHGHKPAKESHHPQAKEPHRPQPKETHPQAREPHPQGAGARGPQPQAAAAPRRGEQHQTSQQRSSVSARPGESEHGIPPHARPSQPMKEKE